MRKRREEMPEFQKIGPEGFAYGEFDAGALTERKMIGFGGEGSHIHRLGPLYYWAWGQAHRQGATVPWHPHRGFEIFTYMLSGRLEHRDSLGHQACLSAGDLQLMKSGAGLEHEECFVEAPSTILQVWLDPDFRRAISSEAEFQHVARQDFYWQSADGQSHSASEAAVGSYARLLLGEQSPVQLMTPQVSMQELRVLAGDSWQGLVKLGEIWSAIVLKGQGSGRFADEEHSFVEGDYLVMQPRADSSWSLSAQNELHVVWIKVPSEPGYSLFPKPRGARRSAP